MMLNNVIRKVAYKTVLLPPRVRYCSQTIYEALIGCCRMWKMTKSSFWKCRAEYLVEILKKIQQPDGGFDIGYEFNFGLLHKKGQSTSPELVGLLALCEYARLFGNQKVDHSAFRAAQWIRERALELGEGKVAIPYSPYTINEIMVYNGTSFACGALGYYLGMFGTDDDGLFHIYHGMVRYLESVLSKAANLPGRFWYYCDQTRDDLDELRRRKIDYYHQMQQVEMHALAQQVCPVDLQLRIIRDAADHIVALHERNSIIPYTNDPRFFKNQIHLWGLSSVVSGMLEAAVVICDRRQQYRRVARDVLKWILKYAWNGKYFAAILNKDGSRVEPSYYMVRSDAWVFNSIAAGVKHFDEGRLIDIAENCYLKMESVDFSGPESHASNLRKRFVSTVWARIKEKTNGGG